MGHVNLKNGIIQYALIAVLLLLPSAAFADTSEKKVISEMPEAAGDGADTGWKPALRANGNFYLGQTSNVPGATDGLSFAFGYIIDGKINYLSSNSHHEWTNSLFWELGFTRTPVVDVFTKSFDKIDFQTSYLYHIPKVHWLGPFVTARLTTSMLKSYEVRADATDVIRLGVGEEQQFDGTGNLIDENGVIIDATHPSVDNYASTKKIKLTDAFAPLLLRQAVGLFAIPVDKPQFKLDFRLGIASWETFVQNGYVIEDNDATADFLELRQMEDSVQVGAELGMVAGGVLKERITYGLSALFMQPFAENVDTKLKGVELMNMEFEATLGIALWEFLSVNYAFKAYRQPLIVDDWQIQNSLMISLGINLPRPAPEAQEAPCECPVCNEKAEEKATDEETSATGEKAAEDNTAEETSTTEEAATEGDDKAAEEETPATEEAAAESDDKAVAGDNTPAAEETPATEEAPPAETTP